MAIISRRGLLVSSIAAATAAMPGARAARPGSDLTELTAVEALALLRRGELTAETYAAALLQRCDAAADLNAFISFEPERVLEAARAADRRRASGERPGPLHGLPIPVKDSVNTRCYPTTGGTPALRRFRPAEDAPVVRRLLEAGAVILGKTNVHELSFGWTSNNLAFGAVRNPYDPARIPGGSSGGTAAAVAARMAPLGIAEDTQGSIRVPAALCGVCGFRPTTGRYPNQGVIPITPLFDQVGPHARSVADLQLFDTVMTGEGAAPPRRLDGVRLGIDRGFFFEGLDEEVARVTEAVLERLNDAGAVLVEARVPGLAELLALTTAQIQLYDVQPRLIEYLHRYRTGIGFDELLARSSLDTRAIFTRYVLPGAAEAVPSAAFEAARDRHLPELRRTLARWFRDHDLAAMVFPATRIPAPPIGLEARIEIGGLSVAFQSAISRNISPGSTAGLPGLVVPAGLTAAGLPVGLELDAPAGSDRSLLALGWSVETLLGRLPAPPADHRLD